MICTPNGDDSIIIEAEVDRGTNIDEVDEIATSGLKL